MQIRKRGFKMKKFFRIIFSRLLYTLLFVIVQCTALGIVLRFFSEKFVYFYAACILLSILTGLHVISSNMNPAYKIAWLIPIMLVPIFGGLMYLMFGKIHLSQAERKRLEDIQNHCEQAMKVQDNAYPKLAKQSVQASIHSTYLAETSGALPYQHTSTEYLPIGEKYFEVMKEQLESAEKFIFLEYFIVEEGKMWNEILDILKRKVQEGVDVRVMYDDFGCMFTLPRRYDRTLEKCGIKTCVFERFNSILNSRFNARDHRKICVVDGNIGLTGGINLADEYINETQKFGHWKDTGMILKGQAVWSLTIMFLSMWDYIRKEQDDFQQFAPSKEYVSAIQDDGYVQPYTDTPFHEEPVGENVYMNIINRANEYVYITTPYLIIDNEMLTAMRMAARSGVDIRIITPGVADKKMVYAMTRSHYESLLKAGVRIYEYTPGFIHAKTFVSDDAYGIVGTINLDYRSLHLHYENAVWMYQSKAVYQVKNDFMETLKKCNEVTLDTMKKKNFVARICLAVMRAFAPLM